MIRRKKKNDRSTNPFAVRVCGQTIHSENRTVSISIAMAKRQVQKLHYAYMDMYVRTTTP